MMFLIRSFSESSCETGDLLLSAAGIGCSEEESCASLARRLTAWVIPAASSHPSIFSSSLLDPSSIQRVGITVTPSSLTKSWQASASTRPKLSFPVNSGERVRRILSMGPPSHDSPCQGAQNSRTVGMPPAVGRDVMLGIDAMVYRYR